MLTTRQPHRFLMSDEVIREHEVNVLDDLESRVVCSIPCIGGPLDGTLISNTDDFVHNGRTRYVAFDIQADTKYRVFYAIDLLTIRDVMLRLLHPA